MGEGKGRKGGRGNGRKEGGGVEGVDVRGDLIC